MNTPLSRSCILTTLGGVALLASPAAAQTFFGPTPYLSPVNSPFTGPFNYFHLEDFEDNALNAPGLTGAGGVVIGPGPFTDSVDSDGDDMQIDGFGNTGNSYFSAGTATFFDFSFDAVILGSLPTHAGVVWTDVGSAPTPGVDQVTFEAFGPLGQSLGTIGPVTLGDGVATGTTGDDRFFGVSSLDGISRIRISMANSTDWEVDHVQYGLIPSPGATALLIAGTAMTLHRRRR